MSSKDFKYLYGPVPSRRLGRSLGVDLVPFKTCTYDCIYCQLGKNNKQNDRETRLCSGGGCFAGGPGKPFHGCRLRLYLHGWFRGTDLARLHR